MSTQHTQTEQNKSLVRRYYEEVANAATPDSASAGADRLLSNDFTFYPPNAADGEQGLDNHKGFLHWHHGVAPDQHWTAEDMIAEGDKVAVLFSTRGTQQGSSWVSRRRASRSPCGAWISSTSRVTRSRNFEGISTSWR